MSRHYHVVAQRRWTRSAVECYKLGCVCHKCFLYEIMGDRCRMKNAVIDLVRRFGRPLKELEN